MTSANKGSGISWLLENNTSYKDLTDDDLSRRFALVKNTFISNSEVLNYESKPDYGLLMQVQDLSLRFGKGENQIDHQYLTGAGSLFGDNPKHLIMLLLLTKNAVSDGLKLTLSICDSFGSLLEYDSIPELFNLLEPLGFKKDELRQLAEAVGFCEQAIDLSSLNIADQEDYFF